MMYENDRLNIPEEYKKMSVSELRNEKQRVYEEIRKKMPEGTQRVEKPGIAMFHF